MREQDNQSLSMLLDQYLFPKFSQIVTIWVTFVGIAPWSRMTCVETSLQKPLAEDRTGAENHHPIFR